MSTPSTEDVQLDAPTVNGTAPHWLRDAGPSGTDTPTVAALCERFSAVCASAVDSLEVASALEFDGFSDNLVRSEYGLHDVFALARTMYRRVPRRPAVPVPAPRPRQAAQFRPLLHGLLYALPALCVPAAAGVLAGPGVLPTLVLALMVAWGLSQGLACAGYLRRAGSADEGQVKRVLRAGLAAGLLLVALAMLVAGLCFHPDAPVLWFGVGEGAYMLGASVLMVVGAETWLPAALVPGLIGSGVFWFLGRPGVVGSGEFLYLGSSPQADQLAWWALGMTPLLACFIALACTRKTGPRTGRLLTARELQAAMPAIAFGVVAAGLLTFPIVAGPDGHGGVNTGALLVSLPLSLSMGAAEWSLLWYRRRARQLLDSISRLRTFRRRARRTLLAALSQYLCGTAVLIAAAVTIAAAAGFARPDGTDLAVTVAYLMLGSAMFLALLLQIMRLRAVPLLLTSAALAAELALRDLGMIVQVLTPAALLIVIGCYALVSLGSAVRHV
jgi:hypothetical protein